MWSRNFFEIEFASAMSATWASAPGSSPARCTMALRPYFPLLVSITFRRVGRPCRFGSPTKEPPTKKVQRIHRSYQLYRNLTNSMDTNSNDWLPEGKERRAGVDERAPSDQPALHGIRVCRRRSGRLHRRRRRVADDAPPGVAVRYSSGDCGRHGSPLRRADQDLRIVRARVQRR